MATSAPLPELPSTDTPWSPITLPSYPFLGSMEQDPVAHMAGEMAVIHNFIIRSLNAIWHNAPVVTPNDTQDFVAYCLLAVQAVHSHHNSEEIIAFPKLTAAGVSMEQNIEQHRAFDDAMVSFEKYLNQVKSGEVQFDGVKTRELLVAFADPLVFHLHEEVRRHDLKYLDL
jgi:hemerythrin-like domain-containing protein